MASTSVEFYQKQNELRDSMKRSEEERHGLENQIKTYFKSDQRVAKLKAVRLNNYWKKLCDDEKRSKERNAQLLREFERIDSHLSSMGARTEKLQFLKKQYEETIERKYPNWRQLACPTLELTNQQTTQPQTENKTPQSGVAPSNQSTPHHYSQQNPNQESTQSKHWTSQHSSPYKQADVPQVPQESSPARVSPTFTETGSGVKKLSRVEEVDIQPVQNVTIQKIQSPTGQKSGPMEPDDDSDIGSDLELPLSSKGQKSPAKKSSEKLGIDNPGLQGTSEAVGSIETEVASHSAKSMNKSIRADMTLTGIIYLLKYVQDDFRDAFSFEGYYKTSPPDSSLRSNIIHKANNGENLSTIDANLVSMVILEQLTLVIRHLVNSGLLTDEMLMSDTSRLTADTIGLQLPSDACDLWDSLFNHFSLLVQFKVMEPKEVAAVFVPCLVADGSQHQQKAFSLLVRLLEEFNKDDGTDGSSMASPHHQSPVKHTPRSYNDNTQDQGTVPPLKFGSLIDRPFSDDESTSLFDQTNSRNQPAVPLNETDAYKNMLSGTRNMTNQNNAEEEEDTDDDVEKQFASVLSPRTTKSSVLSPRRKKDGGNIFTPRSSHDSIPSARSSKGDGDFLIENKVTSGKPDDFSDASSFSHGASPVYVPTAMDHRSTMPSTGSYPIPNKRPGLRIGSDLDTDTEGDFMHKTSKNKTEDEDDFDFYN
ncbi:uncharacterized protein LOC126820973 isoform X3 [Patella vulgata]|uniref:uncharacterized protein LOC126820973 isoform X3 n=1 Tax=Patella vulgata TaxID=6465 RepID=UPI0021806350|nr:uncharacterized protein LOC126820973 isoform X3 [Patella vulgata]